MDFSFFMFVTGLVHTDTGKHCSDIAMRDLSNYQQCQLASTYAITFNTNAQWIAYGLWSNYPRGCYIDDDGSMYFNGHDTGESQSSSRAICKAGNT